MPQEKKGRNPRVSKGAKKPQCYVHGELFIGFAKDLRENVCVNDEPLTEFEGKYYCLFHLPTNDKDDAKFMSILQARFQTIGKKIREIDNLPEDEKGKAKSKAAYDFRYVWFPTGIGFENIGNNEFKSSVHLDYATFAEFVSYQNTKFRENASFMNVKFLSDVDFRRAEFFDFAQFEGAEFKRNAYFDECEFGSNSYFNKATFFLSSLFRKTKFSSRARFDTVTFSGNADFWSSVFEQNVIFENAKLIGDISFLGVTFKNQATFASATFSKKVDFSFATFEDNLFFNQAKFEVNSKLFLQKVRFNKAVCSLSEADISGYIHFIGGERAKIKDGKAIFKEGTTLKEVEEAGFIGKESYLDLQNAYVEKPERISFQNIRLQPSWFINVDGKKFVFSNCSWTYTNKKDVEVESELINLEIRGVTDRYYLLMRSCWQLADNFEEMKHFDDASTFRFIALESIRRFFYKGFKVWTLHWWYFISSFYGESPMWASIILLSLLFIFAIIFTGVDFQICPIDKPVVLSIQQNACIIRPLETWEAVRHSLANAAFQNIEYRKPLTGWGETWIVLEKILAPLQAALLALAIRRKFMR